MQTNRSAAYWTYYWIIELKDGRKISAIDVQRIYLRAASKLNTHPSEDRQWILREWENVLNDLERDVMSTRDRIDWTAKKFLLDALQEEENFRGATRGCNPSTLNITISISIRDYIMSCCAKV